MSEEKILLSAKMAIMFHSLINAHQNYMVDIYTSSKRGHKFFKIFKHGVITMKEKVDNCHTRGGTGSYFCQTTNYVISTNLIKLIVLLVDYYWQTPFYDKGTLSNALWRKQNLARAIRKEGRKTYSDSWSCFQHLDSFYFVQVMEEIYKRRSILRTNILTKHTERDLTELVERMRDLRES